MKCVKWSELSEKVKIRTGISHMWVEVVRFLGDKGVYTYKMRSC